MGVRTWNRHHGGKIITDVKGRQEVVCFISRLTISTFLLYIICSVWLHDLGIGVFALAAIVAAVTTPINLRNAKIGLIQFGITTAIAYICSFWAVAGGINLLICILLGIPMRLPFFVFGLKYTHKQKVKNIPKPYNQMSRREIRESVQQSKAKRDEENRQKMEKIQAENQKKREKAERKRKVEDEFSHT